MTPWKDLVRSTTRRCRLAAALDMNTVFTPEGALALASLLDQMAKLIDDEIAVRSAADMARAVIEGSV